MTDFDPFDDDLWRAGTSLHWWDSTLRPPRWLPDPEDARETLTRHPRPMLHALGLIHSYRTLTTGQLHELDATLPAQPYAVLWLRMAAVGLIDLGFPIDADGQGRFTPRSTRFMACRLPVHRPVDGLLADMGVTPVQLASLGPGPLRGARQYDRHNLITGMLAVTARKHGWMTAGEAWCRFDMMTGDPAMGRGGPDLALIGDDVIQCVELTASTNMGLADKFTRWRRILLSERCRNTHVIWLSAGMGDDTGIHDRLTRLSMGETRMHAASARQWADTLTCDDGWHTDPGTPLPPDDWMTGELTRLGTLVGFRPQDTKGWRLSDRLSGEWLG